MRANIAINDRGAVLTANGTTPPPGGMLATRLNQNFAITLDRAPTVNALLTLIRTLRAIDTNMELTGAGIFDGTNHTSQTICLPLAQMALRQLEEQNPTAFRSDIEFITPNLLTFDTLPGDLVRLARVRPVVGDVPASLIKIYGAQIKNMALLGQSLSMKLCYIAVPKGLSWPNPPPLITQPFDICLDPPANLWLEIVYELALATHRHVHHFGTLALPTGKFHQFHRLVYPIKSENHQANNHRICSTAILTDLPDAVII